MPGLVKLLESVGITGINVSFWCVDYGFNEDSSLSDVAEDAHGFVDSLKYSPRKGKEKLVNAHTTVTRIP